MGAPSTPDHGRWMELALEQARQAASVGEVPVGAVVVHEGQVIGAAHNRRELDQDPLAHAEMLALGQAARSLGSWRLVGTALYVTLEPCPMCAGALVNARVETLVYGCDDPKAGAVRSLFALCEDVRLNHRVQVVRGVQAEACAGLLKSFFATLRGGEG
jgi:tRNA(adenine34) deaminase